MRPLAYLAPFLFPSPKPGDHCTEVEGWDDPWRDPKDFWIVQGVKNGWVRISYQNDPLGVDNNVSVRIKTFKASYKIL